ncbi:MAG: TRAP transporter TatT component family protein [Archangium sp.]|nr:TRAP transporter TatT component family protein [Archangium sp.]MDP3570778.1 TRAP transporter TatT component family protein [Archangium sp.]
MIRFALTAALALLSSGCIRSFATGVVADALSGPGTLGTDDDPELVRDAAPFGLKTMESVLASQPEHVGLLTSLASGFTQYGYAFVQQDADQFEFEGKNAQAAASRLRAKKLLLRARDYGLTGLELSSPGITEKLKSMRGLTEAVAPLKKEDVPLVYWTAAAWSLAISNGKEDMGLVAELPAPEALMKRALELDETWEEGALLEFFVSFEAARPGGTEAGARAFLDRSLKLSGGRHFGVQVSWAEGVLVQAQKREEFEAVLKSVIAADVNASKKDRLANTIAQRRAKLLLKYADDLFN